MNRDITLSSFKRFNDVSVEPDISGSKYITI
jgi:hypothetical protein